MGVVTVGATWGNGNHTPASETITASANEASQGAPPTASLQVRPEFQGGAIEAYVDPGSGGDGHQIYVLSQDSGRAYLRTTLTVHFPAQDGVDYNVSWIVGSTTIRWKGNLSRTHANGTAYASFRAFTKRPFATSEESQPGFLNDTRYFPIDADAKWEHTLAGVNILPIDDGPVTVAATNPDGTVLSKSFPVTAQASGPDQNMNGNGDVEHDAYTLLGVELAHTVSDEQNGGEFRSQTSEWKVYNWTLSVSVDKP